MADTPNSVKSRRKRGGRKHRKPEVDVGDGYAMEDGKGSIGGGVGDAVVSDGAYSPVVTGLWGDHVLEEEEQSGSAGGWDTPTESPVMKPSSGARRRGSERDGRSRSSSTKSSTQVSSPRTPSSTRSSASMDWRRKGDGKGDGRGAQRGTDKRIKGSPARKRGKGRDTDTSHMLPPPALAALGTHDGRSVDDPKGSRGRRKGRSMRHGMEADAADAADTAGYGHAAPADDVDDECGDDGAVPASPGEGGDAGDAGEIGDADGDLMAVIPPPPPPSRTPVTSASTSIDPAEEYANQIFSKLPSGNLDSDGEVDPDAWSDDEPDLYDSSEEDSVPDYTPPALVRTPEEAARDTAIFVAAIASFFGGLTMGAFIPALLQIEQSHVMAAGMLILIGQIVFINFCPKKTKKMRNEWDELAVTPSLIANLVGPFGLMIGGLFGGVLKFYF